MARIQCSHCGKAYQLPDEKHAQYAGKRITCKACQQAFVVPPPDAAAPAPAPAPVAPMPVRAAAPPPLPRQQPAAPVAPAARKMTPMEMYEAGMNAPEPENNGWAKGALVAGIAGVIVPVVPGLLAIGLGIVGLLKARRPNVGGRNIALLGMAIAVAGMVLHGLIVMAAIPKVKTVMAMGKRVVCTVHLAAIGQAMEEYTQANNGAYPDSIEQLLLTSPNLHPTFLVCPATEDTAAPGATSTEQAAALKTPGHLSYVYVGKGLHASTQPAAASSTSTGAATTTPSDEEESIPTPRRSRAKKNSAESDLVILYEPPANHGSGGMNVLWGDGRISFVKPESATKILAELKAGHNPPAKPPGGWKSESDGILPD